MKTKSTSELKLESFEQLNKKYLSLHKKYTGVYEQLISDVEAKAHHRQYAKGGWTIHRGFYSPSFQDLVTGGCNRGRLLKKEPKSRKYSFEYIFDEHDRLICVKRRDDNVNVSSVEMIVYEETRVLSLVYDVLLNHAPHCILECWYENNNIRRYERATLELGGSRCFDIIVEESSYEEQILSSVLMSVYIPEIHTLKRERYDFYRDEKGQLNTYTVRSIGVNSDTDVIFEDPKVYKVF